MKSIQTGCGTYIRVKSNYSTQVYPKECNFQAICDLKVDDLTEQCPHSPAKPLSNLTVLQRSTRAAGTTTGAGAGELRASHHSLQQALADLSQLPGRWRDYVEKTWGTS